MSESMPEAKSQVLLYDKGDLIVSGKNEDSPLYQCAMNGGVSTVTSLK